MGGEGNGEREGRGEQVSLQAGETHAPGAEETLHFDLKPFVTTRRENSHATFALLPQKRRSHRARLATFIRWPERPRASGQSPHLPASGATSTNQVTAGRERGRPLPLGHWGHLVAARREETWQVGAGSAVTPPPNGLGGSPATRRWLHPFWA